MYNYISVLNKPTAVSNSITANFLNSSTKLNLILSKSNIIEIYQITKEGLESTPYINLNGTIAVLDKIRGVVSDNLFIVTEDLEYCILNYNEIKKVIRTVDKGSLKEDIGKRLDKIHYAIDQQNYQFVVCCCYKNIVKVISTNKSSDNITFRIDYDELILFKPIFSGKNNNTPQSYGILKSTSVLENKTNVINNQNIIFTNFWVDMNEKTLNHSCNYVQSWKIDLTSSPNITYMFSPKVGGLVLCFTNNIKYYKFNHLTPDSICNFKERKIITSCEIDENRYLLGDDEGNLILLGFGTGQKMVFSFLGEINYISTITYLDNYHAFVGSQKANSLLIKILTEVKKNDAKKPFIEIVEEYDNLAPILDFHILNNNDANTEFLCVSGYKKHCGLKILRKGISLNVDCDIEIPCVKNLFPVNITIDLFNSRVNTTGFFITLVHNTTFLIYNPTSNSIEFNNTIMVQKEVPTIFACNYKEYIVQLTKNHLNYYDQKLKLIKTVQLTNPISLYVFKSKQGMLNVFTTNNLLLKYNLNTNLEDLPDVILSDVEISAFNIKRDLLVYSLWNSPNIYTLDLKTKKQSVLFELEGNIFANSITFLKNENGRYLFIALSNGKLLFFKKSINNNFKMISNYLDDYTFQRKYIISNSVFELERLKLNGNQQIFINTNTPSFLLMQKENPIVSSFNTTSCSRIVPLSKYNFKDMYAYVFDSSIVFGRMSNDMSQNISTKSIGKQVYKVTNIPEKNLFAMVYEQENEETYNILTSFVLIDRNYNEVEVFELEFNESCHTYTELYLRTDESNEILVFALGTAYLENIIKEPESGRIILVKLSTSNKVIKVGEIETQGGVNSITGKNNLIYVASGSTLSVIGITKSNAMKNGLDYEMKVICKSNEFTAINEMICHEEYIVVSDLYRSITILKFDEIKEKLIECCRDFSPTLVNAISSVGEDHYIVGDDDCNIRVLKRMTTPKNDEDKYKLERVGQINLGTRINKFINVKRQLDNKEYHYLLEDKNNLINFTYYATMDGTIGVLINLPLKTYEFLLHLQQEILKYIYSTGNLSYEKWRAFKDGYLTDNVKNFVDGGLIEEYLNFDSKQRQEVFKNMNYPNKLNFNETFNLIEQLKKFH